MGLRQTDATIFIDLRPRGPRLARTTPPQLGGRATIRAKRPQDELVAELGAAGVPVAPVAHGRAVDENPQMRARGFFEAVEHPVSGRHEIPGLPMRFSSRRSPWHRGHPPLLGQHNDEILAELGVDAAERERLRREAVIGERPVGR